MLAAVLIAAAWAAPARADTELTLDQAVEMAIARNPTAEAAELAVQIARIAVTRATLDRISASVAVTGGANAGVTKPWGDAAYGSTSAAWDGRGSLSVPLTAGGRINATVERAELGARSAELDARITKRELARAAYSAYWNLVGFERQIAATEEGLAATRQALDIIKSKAEVGLAAGVDVNRSTVDLLSQQDVLVSQQAARRTAEIELAQLLHLEDTHIVLVSTAPEPATGPVTVSASALDARPELAQHAVSAQAAAADVRIARSAGLPTVALGAEAGIGAAAVGGGAPIAFGTGAVIEPGPMDAADVVHPAFDASIGLTLTWNPFDLLRTHHAIAQARLAERQVAAANSAERDRLEADLRSAVVRVETLRARWPLVAEQLALARDNQTIVQDLYAQGSSTILDLFNAQSAFRGAAIQEASLTVELATAELDLAWLLGADTPEAGPNARGATP